MFFKGVLPFFLLSSSPTRMPGLLTDSDRSARQGWRRHVGFLLSIRVLLFLCLWFNYPSLFSLSLSPHHTMPHHSILSLSTYRPLFGVRFGSRTLRERKKKYKISFSCLYTQTHPFPHPHTIPHSIDSAACILTRAPRRSLPPSLRVPPPSSPPPSPPIPFPHTPTPPPPSRCASRSKHSIG